MKDERSSGLNNMPRPSPDDIVAFLAVMQTGSTRAAADVLGLSQPTVSRRIDALEHALGLTLFERSPRGFDPTSVARKLSGEAAQVKRALEMFDSTATQIRKSVTSKVIRVTSTVEVFERILSPLLSRYGETAPEVVFETVLTNQPLDLVAGEADIAFRHGDKGNEADLTYHHLGDVSWAIYSSQDRLKDVSLPMDLNDLHDKDCVLFEHSVGPQLVRAWAEDLFAKSRIVLRCDTLQGVLSAVCNGVGFAPLPCSVARGIPELVKCLAPDNGVAVPFWIVYPTRGNPRYLVEFIEMAQNKATAVMNMLETETGNQSH
ncbi:LysR family transcriptional regulator [Ruegeria lacuscaerulensis]|uniref:LysR family transcriptional regulator n=1 Tax=Ruegeria lacuscaerulensis TaxID=55218 RepID=UPI00147F303E|nr:LysR family transcriptional regulator [Ruegeria lacuscaerulensis]